MELGIQQYKLKFDESYRGDLFAVQGDTGRVIKAQVLDELDNPVNVTSLTLEFYIGNSEKVTMVPGEIEDAEKGIFRIDVVSGQLLYSGLNKAQFVLKNTDKKIGSKIIDIWIEESIENGATTGRNVILDFSQFDEAVALLRELDFESARELSDNLSTQVAEASAFQTSFTANMVTAGQIEARLSAVVQDAEVVDGTISTKIQTIDGWLSNPEQFKGPKGDVGPEGPRGLTGDTGPQGIPGPQGERGIQGLTGESGPQGERGPEGPMGKGLTILGEKTSESELPSGSEVGDSYLIDGHLWVWNGTTWTDIGDIKGPRGEQGPKGDKGEPGDPASNLVTSVNGQIGEVIINDTTYSAGNNVTIGADNKINAKDTTYTAGTNVTINSSNQISATDTTYGLASASANGLMSSDMWTKLNGFPSDNIKRSIVLTQSAYDALSTSEKNRTDTIYFVSG